MKQQQILPADGSSREEINLIDLWQVLCTEWHLILIGLIVSLCLAGLYLAVTPRQYEATYCPPLVHNPQGGIEDSARYFPTLSQLCSKLLGFEDGRIPVIGQAPLAVDWVAGMFMLFPTNVFREVGGFDEDFFLYYEDVDICARLWKAGLSVILNPTVCIEHAAQRASRRSPRYLAWHLSSMARYFYKHAWRLPQTRANA